MATDNTTTTLSPGMQTYYEKVFLERSQYKLVLKEGGQMRTCAANEGKTVNFTYLNPSAIDATALTESCNPPACIITASTVAMTLAEYGKTFRSSKFLALTSIDRKQKEFVEVAGQSMGQTLNRVVRTELRNGTAYRPNSHTVATMAAGDVLSASAIREITKSLELSYAFPYADGSFIGKTNPYSKYSLLGDSTWIAAKTYVDTKDLYMGEPISPLSLKFGGADGSVIPSEGIINEVQLSILVGSLLGDGCLLKPKGSYVKRGNKTYFCEYDSYVFEEQHAEKQKDYLFWKAAMLYPFAQTSMQERKFGKVYRLIIRPGGKYGKMKKILNTLHQLFYPNGKKVFSKKIIPFINELVFAVWFFDDGCISIKGNKSRSLARNNLKKMARLSTCCYRYKEQLLIAKTLHKKLSIQPAVYKDGKYYRLYFGATNGMFDRVRDLLAEVREKYGVKGMDYKIMQRVETKWGTANNSRRYSPNYQEIDKRRWASCTK